MSSNNETEILEIRACMSVTLHIAAKVEQDPSQIGNAKQRYLNVFKVEVYRRVASAISKRTLSHPVNKANPIHGQFSLRQRPLKSVITPILSGSSREAILIQTDLSLEDSVDTCVAENPTVSSSIAVSRNLPLGRTKIAAPQETDFTVAPRLLGGPLNQLTKAIDRGWREAVVKTRRLTRASREAQSC